MTDRKQALEWAVQLAAQAGEKSHVYHLEKLLEEENDAIEWRLRQKRDDAFRSLKMDGGVYLKNANFNDLPVGTLFYLHNGHWSGSIIEVDGVKHVQVGEAEEYEGRRYIPTEDTENELTVLYPDE